MRISETTFKEIEVSNPGERFRQSDPIESHRRILIDFY